MRPALLFALFAALLVMQPATASAVGGSVTVDIPVPLQVTVNGAPYLITASTSALQGTVCMPESVYQDSFSRYQFAGWYSNGTLVTSQRCLLVSSGSYLAHFSQQYAVTVVYSPQDEVANTTWVNAGGSVSLALPTTINGSSYEYRLQQVTVSGSSVYAPAGLLTVSAEAPIVVDAVYTQYVNVTLVLPSGTSTVWVASGQSWYHVFPYAIPDGPGTSLRLKGFIVLGGSAYLVANSTFSFTPTSPTVVQPIYGLYSYVSVVDPSGVVTRGWYERGSLLNASVPPQIVVNDGERLVFVGWDGVNGTSQISVPVVGPANYTASYEVQYQVTQSSPLGSAATWQTAGKSTAVFFPTSLPASLGFTRVLTSVLVNGVATPNTHGVVIVTAAGPTQVVGVYDYSPDWVFITLIAVVAAVVLLGYVLKIRFPSREQARLAAGK